jgi:uncharacterized membrane protein
MAGIGFELRKLLQSNTILGTLKAYGYAGVISSGPWVLSIIGIMILGLLILPNKIMSWKITQFQISATYLIAFSLILSGLFQHAFTRFIADRLYDKQTYAVVPNFHGVMLVITLISGPLSLICLDLFMSNQSGLYRILMNSCFVVMCNVWIGVTLLSGLKSYKAILILFFVAYSFIVIFGLLFKAAGLNTILLGFFLGHLILWLFRNSRGYVHQITS